MDDGERIIGHVGRAVQSCTVFNAQGDVAAQDDGPGKIFAGRDDDLAAAEEGDALDREADGFGVLGGAVANRAKVADAQAQRGFEGSLRCGRVDGGLCGLLRARERLERGDCGSGEQSFASGRQEASALNRSAMHAVVLAVLN